MGQGVGHWDLRSMRRWDRRSTHGVRPRPHGRSAPGLARRDGASKLTLVPLPQLAPGRPWRAVRYARLRDDRRWGLCGRATRAVLLHLPVEPRLVLGRLILVLLLLLRGEGPPALAEHYPHVDELDPRVLSHYLGAHVESEEDEGSASALRLVRIPGLLHVLLVEAAVLHEVAGGIVAGGGDIGGHLGLIAGLVLGGVRFPSVLLFLAEALVHVRCVFG